MLAMVQNDLDCLLFLPERDKSHSKRVVMQVLWPFIHAWVWVITLTLMRQLCDLCEHHRLPWPSISAAYICCGASFTWSVSLHRALSSEPHKRQEFKSSLLISLPKTSRPFFRMKTSQWALQIGNAQLTGQLAFTQSINISASRTWCGRPMPQCLHIPMLLGSVM